MLPHTSGRSHVHRKRFINNRAQSVPLPQDVCFSESGLQVEVRVRGNERIHAPAGQTWDSFFLGDSVVSDAFMTARAPQRAPSGGSRSTQFSSDRRSDLALET